MVDEKKFAQLDGSQGEHAVQRLLFAVVCYLSENVRCVAESSTSLDCWLRLKLTPTVIAEVEKTICALVAGVNARWSPV